MTLTMSSQMLSSRTYPEKEWGESGTSWSSDSPLQIPDQLLPVVSQLLELLALDSGWNSYGARRIDPRSVVAAVRLLVKVRWDGPLPSVSPTPQGGVQLEWGGQDDGVELLFSSNGTLSAVIEVDGEVREYGGIGPGDPIVSDALTWAFKLA